MARWWWHGVHGVGLGGAGMRDDAMASQRGGAGGTARAVMPDQLRDPVLQLLVLGVGCGRWDPIEPILPRIERD